MNQMSTAAEPIVERRVFPSWSVTIPTAFAETFITEDEYWHAWDEHRSVSLTSVLLTYHGEPASAERILRQLGPLDGSPIDLVPPGLQGLAATGPAEQPARASQVLSGLLATHGRILVASITSDDLQWALRVWMSIRCHAAPFRPCTGRASHRPTRCRGH
jgi:hypothetical protein